MSKLSPNDLDRYIFSRTGAPNEDLLVGPAYGEDAAAIAVGNGDADETMVVSTDPISLAAERIGTLGVAIASNDVAACGGVPEWLVSTILLPELDVDLLDDITAQLQAEAERLGITIVGGHTETVAALARPLLSLTCMGPTDRYIPTSGANVGDAVILTKGAGIEGTAVLATDFRETLEDHEVDAATLDRSADFFDDISVLPESAVLAPVATAMHDPTEGGVLNGLVELACASGVRIDIDVDIDTDTNGDTDVDTDTDVDVNAECVPIRPETRTLCAAMDVDPLRILGSGALLATVSSDEAADAVAALHGEEIEATVIGTVDESPIDEGGSGVVYDGERYTGGVRDEMYDLWT